MSLIITVEQEYGWITRNGESTYEPELWEKLMTLDIETIGEEDD